MFKLTLGAAALSLIAGMASAGEYTVTVTNNLEKELLAPILITNVANDSNIFMGSYVTPEAEEQILTGDPAMLAARIGPDAMVGHGTDGPPGVLLAPGMSVTFDIKTDATAVRVISMVAPTMLPDTYVTNVVDLSGGGDTVEASLLRFDIGHDEGTMMISKFNAMMDTGDAMTEASSDSMSTASDDTMAASDETMASDTMASDDTMATAPHPNAAAASIIFVKKM